MAEPAPGRFDVPLSALDPAEKARRAASFGAVASHYERYRPGPTPAALDWLLPGRVARVVDLGAGTGALTRLLLDRADEVVAVEPDDRMRAVLAAEVPQARALRGTGEDLPLPDRCADAVLASSSWHWMDTVPTLAEVGRVLGPGGLLGAIWSGPDPEGPFLVQAQALLAARARQGDPGGGQTDRIMGDARRPASVLEIPPGVAFTEPEHETFRRDLAFTADDLIGLLGTLSSIITLDDETRRGVLDEARRLLRDLLGVEGDVTVDVTMRTDAWLSRPGG
jgi:SAM-dependent methyltransferase